MTTTTNLSPARRFVTWIAPVEPREINAVIAAFFLFFFMWYGYFSVRPVREAIGTQLGRDTVTALWWYNAVLSVLLIPLYGSFVARFRRSTFLPGIYGCVGIALALVGFSKGAGDFNPLVGKAFYVFISVVNLLLLSMFYSFLLEIFDRGQSKRLFGPIAAGGSLGAFIGPLLSDFMVRNLGIDGILYVAAGMFAAAIVCQRVLLKIWSDRPGAAGAAEDRPIGGNWWAGVPIILRSPYLVGIALFIVGISAVSTILYFEQLRVVGETYPDRVEQTRIFARMDWIVQGSTVLIQLFLTGRIAARFGLQTLLTIVPVFMIAGFAVLAGSSSFVLFAAVFIARRAGEYAFVRPGREMLWGPFDKETKYKAKNTIDVPVYRGADAIGAQASTALTAVGVTPNLMMLVGAGIAALWGVVGWWLGKQYESGGAARRATLGTVARESEA
jgi:AAA family ATP:ADP antiporter